MNNSEASRPRTSRPESRILILDDEEAVLRLLERILRAAGFSNIQSETDPRKFLPIYRSFEPDILLLDLGMPHLGGLSVLQSLRSRLREGEYFPVLVITGESDNELKHRALSLGAKDFLTKPFDTTEVVLRIENLLQTRELTRRLEAIASEKTGALTAAEVDIAERLAVVVELRDYGGDRHTHRVGRMAAAIAQAIGLDSAQVELYRRAAPLHDIGKIGVPDEILLKRGSLSLEEMDVIKTHTSRGAKLLAGSTSSILQLAEEIALYHHENWDGTGYTPGLAGEEIPLPGRIVSVADVFDALAHDRPYREAWSVERAAEWIEEQRGSKFDPAVVDAFLKVAAVEGLPGYETAPTDEP